MMKDQGKNIQRDESKPEPYRIRLPGFVTMEEVGLGDVAKRVTSSFGLAPCGGCGRRAAMLNQWVVFTGGRTS